MKRFHLFGEVTYEVTAIIDCESEDEARARFESGLNETYSHTVTLQRVNDSSIDGCDEEEGVFGE